MKPYIMREIGLLMLPALLIGGVAWWKSLPAPPAATVSVPISTRSPLSSRAVLTLGTIDVLRLGPVYSQNIWRDEDCSVSVPLRADGPVLGGLSFQNGLRPRAVPPSSAPTLSPPTMSPPMSSMPPAGSVSASILLMQTLQFRLGGFTSESGARFTPAPPGYYNLLTSLDGGWNLQPILKTKLGEAAPTPARRAAFPQALFHGFDLDRVPATLGTIRLDTDLIFPDGRLRTLRVMVRPQWFTWAPRTLHLQDIGWKAPQNGDEGSVVLTVRYSGEKALLIRDEPQGSTIAWQVRPNLDGIGSEIIAQHKLLYNWSPRLESTDGKYNSHLAKDAFVWAKIRRYGAMPNSPPNSPSAAPLSSYASANAYLSQFRFRIQADAPLQNGALTTLHFRFFGLQRLPASVRSVAVFKTEIGVPGDGFLRVSFALPRATKTP